MISIVCSTKKPDAKFKEHMIKTSGLKPADIDFMFFENNGEFSLTEVYNLGLKNSKYDVVVFTHDDINIKSKKWGVKLLEHFNTSDYGVLGVAGTTELSETGKWWDNQPMMVGIVEHRSENKTWVSKFSTNLTGNIVPTVIVDGLFFGVRKDRIKYTFDEEVKNFHFYDIDFSFGNHENGVKVGVIFNIRVLHKSIGQTNDKWEENRISFVNKWEKSLPKKLTGEIFFEDVDIKVKNEPKIGIIILNKSNNEMLFDCINSFREKSKYTNYKVYIGDTGSSEEELEGIREFIKTRPNVSVHEIGKYNFGSNNNKVVNEIIDADTEILIFSNNDIKLLNDAISIMVKKYVENRLGVGTIGCRLHYKNNKVQHSGIASYYVEDKKFFGVTHIGLGTYYNYGGDEEVIGSTGAFLMIGKTLFNTIGQFNEQYIECFEDVELNMNTIVHNKKNFIMNSAVAYHYESVTRDLDDNKLTRLREDYNLRLNPFINKHLNKLHKHIKVIN